MPKCVVLKYIKMLPSDFPTIEIIDVVEVAQKSEDVTIAFDIELLTCHYQTEILFELGGMSYIAIAFTYCPLNSALENLVIGECAIAMMGIPNSFFEFFPTSN